MASVGREGVLSDFPAYDGESLSGTASEAQLVERAKSDPEAFGQLYEANYTRILNYIYHRIHNVAEAEELTSNTFFNALRALPKFRSHAPFSAWLYRIATNEIRMHKRSQWKWWVRKQEAFSEEDVERVYFVRPAVEAEEERREKLCEYARLRQSLGRLPERYQTVLVLRYFESLSYEEVATVLGKRVGTIKSLIHRGLGRLRHLMEKKCNL
jgi:RNA polymerase sigma-70 factor (ECF subfamily)